MVISNVTFELAKLSNVNWFTFPLLEVDQNYPYTHIWCVIIVVSDLWSDLLWWN
jgi:hypothetical protein